MPKPVASRGASELIRLAEKQINAGNLERARGLLSNARDLDPANEYIAAIMERISFLHSSGEGPNAVNDPGAAPAGEPPPAPDDIQRQVRRLTADARSLFERGAYETAFDTLMKAYFLDPLSTDVMKAEELIVPAFEMMRRRGTLSAPAPVQPGAAQLLRDHVSAGMPPHDPPAPQPGAGKPPPARPQGGILARLRKGSLLG